MTTQDATEDRDRFTTFIPVSHNDGTMVNVGLNFPTVMSEAEWNQFQAVLAAMKPALVGSVPADENGAEAGDSNPYRTVEQHG